LSASVPFSGVSATCVPYRQPSRAIPRNSAKEKSHRMDDPATTRTIAHLNLV
jgi:hypothetical protein